MSRRIQLMQPSVIRLAPLNKDLVVLAVHFNPCGYNRPRASLMRFLREQAAYGVPVCVLEVVFGEKEPFLDPVPGRIFHARCTTIAFQKEAALNLLETMISPEIAKVACVDADLHFDHPLWADRASVALRDYKVIQPFRTAAWTDHLSRVCAEKPSAAAGQSSDARLYHPGFAWAMHRDFWSECGGFYAHGIVGGGDCLANMAFLNQSKDLVELPSPVAGSSDLFLDYQTWAAKVSQWNLGKVGVSPGKVVHEYHGDHKNRHYTTRFATLAHYSPKAHMSLDTGLLEWTDQAPESMCQEVTNYFAIRKEDG